MSTDGDASYYGRQSPFFCGPDLGDTTLARRLARGGGRACVFVVLRIIFDAADDPTST